MTDPIRILVVDDDPQMKAELVLMLKMEKYEVFEAENGIKAQEILQKEDFRVVISDIKMPAMNGIDLFLWNKKTKNVPTILMTGFYDLIETKEAYELGVKEFLAKPFQKSDIIKAINNCLRPQSDVQKADKTEARSALSNSGYTQIDIGECIENSVFMYDLYLKVGENKCIRIAAKGDRVPDGYLVSDCTAVYNALILVKKGE